MKISTDILILLKAILFPFLTVITSAFKSPVNEYTCNSDCSGDRSINNCY